MRFLFPHSHAFRRGRVTVDEDRTVGPECLVEFGDGIAIVAKWQADEDAIRLSIPDYRTARGTLVTARTWRLVRGKDGRWRSERLS